MTNNENSLIQVGAKSLIKAGNSIEITNKLLKKDLETVIDETTKQLTEEEINQKQNLFNAETKQLLSNETKKKLSKEKIMSLLNRARAKNLADKIIANRNQPLKQK
jgi:hypothetical protein